MCATCPAHFILLDLITLTIFGEKTDCEFHHYAVFFMIKISSSTLCLQKPSAYVPPQK
jgi:hypothetical protein